MANAKAPQFSTPVTKAHYTSSLPYTYMRSKSPLFLTSIAVSGFPIWTGFTFGPGAVNIAYSEDFDLYPALSPTTFTLQSGSLPPGLVLSSVGSDIGRISGIPTTAGTYAFTLRATNSLGTADQAFSITVYQPASGGSFIHL